MRMGDSRRNGTNEPSDAVGVDDLVGVLLAEYHRRGGDLTSRIGSPGRPIVRM